MYGRTSRGKSGRSVLARADGTYQEAADLAGDTGSSMVIPGHWAMFAINCSDPNEFAEYIDAKYGGKLRCRVPKVMEKISLL